jgi:hypothetical protein
MQTSVPGLPRCWFAACLFVTGLGVFTPALAQNDWQYPDPYFGILEIEKSHDGATHRRSRATVDPRPRAVGAPSPSDLQAEGGAASAAPAAPPAPATKRSRWRSRWRR